jgi:cytochrome c biogenesis protein CcmG, thiol:disulfide interchange protein DsbE
MSTKVCLLTLVAVVLTTLQIKAAPSPNLENSNERFAINEMHGQPAPEWNLTEWFNSKSLRLSDLKGKIVILDFWATWCGPCIGAIPKTNKLQSKYADQGVVIIGICAARGSERMKQTAKDKGIKYPIAIDVDGNTNKRFRANSYPDYFVIDRAGNLRWGDIVNNDVEKAIKILLAETKA